MYPMIWASKLQSQVALSTRKAEYIAMSMALRDAIPVMEVLEEMSGRNFQVGVALVECPKNIPFDSYETLGSDND